MSEIAVLIEDIVNSKVGPDLKHLLQSLSKSVFDETMMQLRNMISRKRVGDCVQYTARLSGIETSSREHATKARNYAHAKALLAANARRETIQ